MAKKVQLSKKINGVAHQIYPKTVYDVVVDKNGKTLLLDITEINSDLERIEDSIPTKLSDLQGGAEIVTESDINAKLNNYYTKDVVDSKLEDIESGPADLKNYYTKNEVYNKSEVDVKLEEVKSSIVIPEPELEDYAKKSDLSEYAKKSEVISEEKVQELIDQAQFPEGGEIKLENYYTKGEVDGKLALKQNKLESGTNIKTINGASILGSGNITIEGGNSSDTTVTQTITSTDSTYPLLFSATADKTTTSEDTARFSSNLKYNPSTDTLTVANISGNASSATTATNANTLNTLNTIDGVNYTGSADITHYVTCTNSGDTTAKTVTLNGFKLVTGARVSIKFSYAQTNATTGAAMTLKVGNTTAKGMYYKTLPLDGANLPFKTGVIYDFIYDGTYWRLQGDWDAQINDASFDFSVKKAQYADQLTTPRTINGVSFDGSSDIEIDTTHIGKKHNAVIYFTGPARGNSISDYEFHTTDGTLVNPKGLSGGIAYLLYNENVVSQAIPLNHIFTNNFFPIKVSAILTSTSDNINNWTDAYIKCGIVPTGPTVVSIHLPDTNRTDVSDIKLDNCTLEGHVYGIF